MATNKVTTKNSTYYSNELVWFWNGPFSNWYYAKFKDSDGVEYNCTEQYFMAMKAKMFGDTQCYNKIMSSDSPKHQKQYGRQVDGFDAKKWDKVSYKIMVDANKLKYKQNPGLAKFLLETGNRQIAEASPYDKIWGILLDPDDPDVLDPNKWMGENRLGKALAEVRGWLVATEKS